MELTIKKITIFVPESKNIHKRKGKQCQYTYAKITAHFRSGGGTSLSDRERIEALERKIELLETTLATEETPGIVRLSSSEAVTDRTGLALSASEKNSSLEGTLGNRIENIRNRAFLKSLPYLGILSAEEENSTDFFRKYYEEFFGPSTSHNDIFPYSFIGPNHISIGYQTTNGYGTQLRFGHYQAPSWRSLYGNGEWSEWRDL